MKISANYWIFEGGLDGTLPIAAAMKQAAQLGYDGIELCIASQGVLTQKTTQAECETFCEEAQKNGLEISGVASGESWGRSPTSNDPEVRQSIIDFTKKLFKSRNGFERTSIYLFQVQLMFSFYQTEKWFRMMSVIKERRTLFFKLRRLLKN